MIHVRPLLTAAALAVACSVLAQDRLAGMIDISERTAKKSEIQAAMKIARPTLRWIDGKTLAMKDGDEWYEIDASSGARKKLAEPPAATRRQRPDDPNSGRDRPARGRQYTEEFSPDGAKRAFYRDGNMWLSDADGGNESAITTEGDESKRTKFGSASWVYGEELGQRDAMGWSPDGSSIWFYEFDDSMVQDYYIAMSQTKVQTTLDTEAYPKAGTPNPECYLHVYNFATGDRTKVKVRPGEFDEGVGHYVYAITWSPDGKELLFHRTNRWQNTMEFCAADPATGDVRVIVREEWPASWTENRPQRQYLDRHADIEKATQYRGKMIWRSARTGFRNFYLVDLDSGATTAITKNPQDATRILRVDLVKGEMFYMAAGPYNPYKMQLHRAKLDGSLDEILTDPNYHHTINLSPDGSFYADTWETLQTPPTTTLRSVGGGTRHLLAESDISEAVKLGFRPTQRVIFKAADGVTDCYGTIQFPADFDPSKKYPVIVNIYA
ncbi:MAG: DPP IV N-terminal domain-containing protein, partial [Armatimonadetes bacterium]|nr:DPP IV N-terminal domain-containing protein [Armatimonadota bacterium]